MIKALQNKRAVSDIAKGKNLSVNKFKIEEMEKERKTKETKDKFKNILKTLKLDKDSKIFEYISNSEGTKQAFGIDSEENMLFGLDTADVFDKISEYSNIKYLILDGILSKRLLSLAINMKINVIFCIEKEVDLKIPRQIKILKI